MERSYVVVPCPCRLLYLTFRLGLLFGWPHQLSAALSFLCPRGFCPPNKYSPTSEAFTVSLPWGPVGLQQGNAQATFIPAAQHYAAVSCRLVSLDLHQTSIGNQQRTLRVGATGYRILYTAKHKPSSCESTGFFLAKYCYCGVTASCFL